MLIKVGTGLFAAAGAVYWLVTGHRPPLELIFLWLVYCGFVVYVWLDSRLKLWRDESKETATNVREILRRVESIESEIKLYQKD